MATEKSDPSRAYLYRSAEHRHVRWGVLAIFLYVGAEVAIGSFLANYAMRPDIGAIAQQDVGKYVSLYWLGAMVGRFIGAALLLKANPRRLLGLYAVMNVALLLATMLGSGKMAMWSVIAIGLFNSIMFPTVFTLVIDRLGPLVPKASSLLVMAIFGGAVIPVACGGTWWTTYHAVTGDKPLRCSTLSSCPSSATRTSSGMACGLARVSVFVTKVAALKKRWRREEVAHRLPWQSKTHGIGT